MELNSVQLMAIEYAVVVMIMFLAFKSSKLRRDSMNYFNLLVCVLAAYALENIPVRYAELHLVTWDRMFVFLLYAIALVLMTFTAAFWFLFDMKLTNSEYVNTRKKVLLWLIPAFGIVPLCVANYWTGWLYVIDEASGYTRGSIFFLQAVISYGYFLIVIINNAHRMITGKEKRRASLCAAAEVPIFAGIATQILFGGSALVFGIVVGAWVIYIEICLDRQKAYEVSEAVRSINDELKYSNSEVASNMRTILALSDIYHTLYEVNLEKDTFTEVKAPEFVSKRCGQYTSARECMRAIPVELFDPGYTAVVSAMFDPDTIEERLADQNSYFVDAIGNFTKDWIRATIIVTQRDENKKPISLVFTFQEIGEVIEKQKKLEEAQIYEIHAKEMKEMFEQISEALVSAIDAKDKYTRGHSVRVAGYAKKIAELAGKNNTECDNIYLAGLLHDIGKIGISEAIICKEGKLTDEEYLEIKQHPVYGNDILQKISRLPFLNIGAKYHHERFDGKGYPSGLKGTDIPEIARIIAVADAYDAMTSKRSYRNPIPQQTVREEIIKGMGTQFDPYYAKMMVHLIDIDTEYQMKERTQWDTDEEVKEFLCEEYRTKYSAGLRVDDHKKRIHFSYEKTSDSGMPSIVFYDSLDACVHKGDEYEKPLYYHEYGILRLDGTSEFDGVRKAESGIPVLCAAKSNTCDIEIVKERDHIYFEMKTNGKLTRTTLALPDSTRYVYVCITGVDCRIYDISTSVEETAIKEGTIKRIADELIYMRGEVGDVPSIQADGYRSKSSDSFLLEDELELTFDMKSLPFARLIWHCPFVEIFHSADGKRSGEDYKEYGVIGLNGESHGEVEYLSNHITVNKTEEFPGWDKWKQGNIDGRHCTVHLKKVGNAVVLETVNGGISIENITEIDVDETIYVSLSGDQCVIENIRRV